MSAPFNFFVPQRRVYRHSSGQVRAGFREPPPQQDPISPPPLLRSPGLFSGAEPQVRRTAVLRARRCARSSSTARTRLSPSPFCPSSFSFPPPQIRGKQPFESSRTVCGIPSRGLGAFPLVSWMSVPSLLVRPPAGPGGSFSGILPGPRFYAPVFFLLPSTELPLAMVSCKPQSAT